MAGACPAHRPFVVTSGNVPPAFLIFALDTSQDPPVVLGPPVTDELSYGHALEEGTPEDQWNDEPWDLAHFVSATNEYEGAGTRRVLTRPGWRGAGTGA